MPLQHQLRMPRLRVPELHPPILGPAHNPIPIWRQRHRQHEILMPLEDPNALPTPRSPIRIPVQLPHPNRLIQRPRNQVRATRRERDTVDTILVPLLALGTLHGRAGGDVPDANVLVKRAGSDEAVVGTHGNRGNSVFYLEVQDALVLLDVPDADGSITGPGSDVAAVGGEVEGVDVLLVAGELVADDALLDVPNLESHHMVSKLIQG